MLGKNSGEGAGLEVLMEAKDLQGCDKSHDEFLASLSKNAAAKGVAIEIAPPAVPTS